MGKKQKMVEHQIKLRRAREKQALEENKEQKVEEKITPEEHERRIKALKDLGLIK